MIRKYLNMLKIVSNSFLIDTVSVNVVRCRVNDPVFFFGRFSNCTSSVLTDCDFGAYS